MNGTETDTPDTVAPRLRSTPANGGTEKVSRKGDEQFMTITESAVAQRIRRQLRNTGYQGQRSGKTQSTAKTCGTAQIGDGQSGPPGETVPGTPTHRYNLADWFPMRPLEVLSKCVSARASATAHATKSTCITIQ